MHINSKFERYIIVNDDWHKLISQAVLSCTSLFSMSFNRDTAGVINGN